jgi:plastocyanin
VFAVRVALLFLSLAAGTGAGANQDTAALCREAQARHQQSAGGASAEAQPTLVLMVKHTFCPLRVTVKPGDTVRRVNTERRTPTASGSGTPACRNRTASSPASSWR